MKRTYLVYLLLSLIPLLIISCGEDKQLNNTIKPPVITTNISAPDSVVTGSFFIASVMVEDPQDLDVQVRFNWGDTNFSEYTDFAPSGSRLEVPYAYDRTGLYSLRVTARNSSGVLSEISDLVHHILVYSETTDRLIQDLLVHNNRFFLQTSSPVNISFEYSTLTEGNRTYKGYSAKNRRSYFDFPLPAMEGNLEHSFYLQLFSSITTEDTLLSFISTGHNYPLLRVDFVDVRQGDGILIQTPERKAVAVDGGYGTNIPSFSQGAYWNGNGHPFMLNYVLNEAVNSFEYLVETHRHLDHYGGLNDIIDYGIPYNYYLSPDNQLEHRVGDYLRVDSAVTFEILNLDYPEGLGTTNSNNRSVVIRIEYGEISYLLAGDIEHQVESYLVANTFQLSADVLKVAHHGSRTSSRDYFLEKVFDRFAKIAVMTFGTGNPYNHPHEVNRFSAYQTFGTGEPSENYHGTNYHFNAGDIKTYSNGTVVIVQYRSN